MRLGVGAAQFGLDYGVSNSGGRTPEAEVGRILCVAAAAGIELIDTAHTYGDSEAVLGQVLGAGHGFKVVTKLPSVRKTVVARRDVEEMRRCALESLRRLRQPNVYAFLAHNADDLLIPGGEMLFDLLQEFKEQGQVEKVGASVYDGAQIERITDRFKLDLIQVPVSILDQRLVASGHLARLKRLGVEIHARSVFLQGLLLLHGDEVPARLRGVSPLLNRLHAALREQRLTPVAGAIQFVRHLEEIDRVIVGVNNSRQLEENIQAYRIESEAVDLSKFACFDEGIVNPAKWGLNQRRAESNY